MNIHEYQAKRILSSFNINVPKGKVVFNKEDAERLVWGLESDVVAVKAQIHAGGRGKAGGVKLANSIDEVKKYTNELLGKVLVTHQTGPEGKQVNCVLLEEGCEIESEYYLGLVLDRDTSTVALIASEEGGTEIEQVAQNSPEKIIKVFINPLVGLTDFQARQIAYGINMPTQLINKAVKVMKNLYSCFIEKDCSIAEINPLVITKENDILALDAKLNFDSNALYRQKDIFALRDESEEDKKELEASRYGLSYISLNGSIGCMVNGAGLAMATMDIIKHYGGNPANFLDVGGGATEDKISKALKIILSDTNVKGVFVNIFGGIMKCDVIARGVVNALKNTKLDLPLVVRLEGTNVEEGKQILVSSTLDVNLVSTLSEGAQTIVSLTEGK
ncbi:ADP-forming succinate--CoA ligase subunit beta [Clostridium sp. 'deep sea']|uniref:ADP-forming succinate--CoA ligase subunit beta n=1 Tax=Clostridium sp. 'deep sea' TaxID=2779445 RepID=UPI0018964752|nr:ADP-forming succinate--CoA ligase subunit beta [Clostridium sp. 'deep sea']QOR34216.1 ADP-forming succinate--CoA ligase subunit beta [Clostridium sp. 'deep sea']